jgi:hypothetical protein
MNAALTKKQQIQHTHTNKHNEKTSKKTNEESFARRNKCKLKSLKLSNLTFCTIHHYYYCFFFTTKILISQSFRMAYKDYLNWTLISTNPKRKAF